MSIPDLRSCSGLALSDPDPVVERRSPVPGGSFPWFAVAARVMVCDSCPRRGGDRPR